jgi:hypothetical protein
MSSAVITRTRVAAAHDGAAELVVTLRHPNGACSDVALDAAAVAALFDACRASRAEELTGHGWEKVRDALAVSWNRFANIKTL